MVDSECDLVVDSECNSEPVVPVGDGVVELLFVILSVSVPLESESVFGSFISRSVSAKS